MLVSASILSNEFKAQDLVKALDKTNVDYIHLDIMDGKFVENKTWTYSEIKKIVSYTTKPLDVHLMVNNPLTYIEDYAMLNTVYLTIHFEAVKNLEKIVSEIKFYGLKVGVSICPKTSVKVLFPYLKDIDEVLIMSVEPGKSGQSFIENTIDKIKELKNEIISQNAKTIISVDGGINDETGLLCKEAGCDMLVSASFIHKNIVDNVKSLKNI